MSLAFVLLDFEHAGIRRRAKRVRRSVDMQEFREVSRTGSIYSMEAHACNFVVGEMDQTLLLCSSDKVNEVGAERGRQTVSLAGQTREGRCH